MRECAQFLNMNFCDFYCKFNLNYLILFGNGHINCYLKFFISFVILILFQVINIFGISYYIPKATFSLWQAIIYYFSVDKSWLSDSSTVVTYLPESEIFFFYPLSLNYLPNLSSSLSHTKKLTKASENLRKRF